ncbi:hypothetical protein BAVI_13764 [Neobacillus vireti LMG 21834]|uniref:Uncharacterized protein n=1 Tax=Neobacillus vireti LMG 21834 TaxID=1131730 RepID=A0AB94IM86_9BACI|nr:hypothetical protein BAVI_13764 [Neobacillus vireti LMG 21834]KLT17399.1 hypothetical protein AA980_16175 [Neobacillus vireti]
MEIAFRNFSKKKTPIRRFFVSKLLKIKKEHDKMKFGTKCYYFHLDKLLYNNINTSICGCQHIESKF